MTFWKSLAGKFTSKEVGIIEDFMGRYGFKNSNQLVRSSILFLVYYIEIMNKLAESKQAKQVDSTNRNLKKMISELPPEVSEPIRIGVKKIQQDVIKNIESSAEEVAENLKSFSEERKVGRPKSLRRPRGKPKDTGI